MGGWRGSSFMLRGRNTGRKLRGAPNTCSLLLVLRQAFLTKCFGEVFNFEYPVSFWKMVLIALSASPAQLTQFPHIFVVCTHVLCGIFPSSSPLPSSWFVYTSESNGWAMVTRGTPADWAMLRTRKGTPRIFYCPCYGHVGVSRTPRCPCQNRHMFTALTFFLMFKNQHSRQTSYSSVF